MAVFIVSLRRLASSPASFVFHPARSAPVLRRNIPPRFREPELGGVFWPSGLLRGAASRSPLKAGVLRTSFGTPFGL
jgi:hypothetical protein